MRVEASLRVSPGIELCSHPAPPELLTISVSVTKVPLSQVVLAKNPLVRGPSVSGERSRRRGDRTGSSVKVGVTDVSKSGRDDWFFSGEMDEGWSDNPVAQR